MSLLCKFCFHHVHFYLVEYFVTERAKQASPIRMFSLNEAIARNSYMYIVIMRIGSVLSKFCLISKTLILLISLNQNKQRKKFDANYIGLHKFRWNWHWIWAGTFWTYCCRKLPKTVLWIVDSVHCLCPWTPN